MKVGTVSEVWRYPVKSMQGEQLEDTAVHASGVLGDRVWAVRDEEKQAIVGAKRIAGLLGCGASFCAPPSSGVVSHVEVVLPDGDTVRSDDPSIGEKLSKAMGREITLWPLQPKENLDHYKPAALDNPDDAEGDLRSILGLEVGEPTPDLSPYAEVLRYATPPGTYFDAFPILVLSTSSLEALKGATPAAQVDVRRFRPNFLVETASSGFTEQSWIGKKLHVGPVVLDIALHCVRCVMTTAAQPGLPKEPRIMRSLVREADQNLGVYASVVQEGRVKVGDAVEVR